MTTDTLLRDRLQARADDHTISVSSLEAITEAGDRRVRRTQMAGGFCTLAIVMIGLFSFAGLRSPEATATMFAGLDVGSDGAPATIITTEDGWLGAVIVGDPLATEDEWVGEVHLATSTDGETWELADPTGLTSTSSELAIDEHGGRLWLGLTENDEVYLAHSDDLETWTRIEIPEANTFDEPVDDGMVRFVSSPKIVANSAGVMAMVRSHVQPDFEALLDIDHDQTCGLQWMPANFGSTSRIGVRPCGQAEWDSYTIEDADLGPSGTETALVFSADGENFVRIDGPHSDRIVLPYSEVQNLYATDSGFGIADYALLESSDGIEWTTFNLNRWSSPALAAASGDLRVTAAMSQTGGAQVQTSSDGEQWASHSLDDAIGITDENPLSFHVRALEVGPAGWAISALLIDNAAMTAEFTQQASDITIQLGDAELRGTLPGGPAELFGADGEVVASWQNFELANPQQNESVHVSNGEFRVVDADGAVLASTPLDTFLRDTRLTSGSPVHTVLFSPDGVTWTELYRNLDYIIGLAVGDDDVVIAQYSADGPTSTRLPVEAD